MLAQNAVARICGLGTQVVLAALLSAASFGIISLTYTITIVASAVLNIGVDDVLLQRQQALRYWTGPAFWFNLILASAVAVIVVGISPFAAAMYGAPDLVGLSAILAVSMPINALCSVPAMILRARMQFGVIALYNTLEILALSLFTIGLAWADYGAYSFVIPVPIVVAVKAAALWRLAASRPNLHPQMWRWKYMVGNTSTVFATRILIALMSQGDYLVLGLLATKDVVGAYYFGFRLAAQPLGMLAGNFSGVLFPALVQLKSDPVRQGEATLNASAMLSFCVMPLSIFQAAIASPLVSLLFDDKWAVSVPVIQILSIGLAFDAVSWVAGAMLNARGEFSLLLRYIMVQTPVFFALVTIGGILDQAVGVAMGVCVFYVITQPIFIWGAYRRIGIRPRQLGAIYLVPALLGSLAIGSGFAISILPCFADRPLARIIVIGLIAVPAYAGLVRWLAPTVWVQLRDRIANAL